MFMLRQDDPSKCTAAKLVKFGLARQVRRTGTDTMVLDPFAEKTVLKADLDMAHSITAIDCSWNLATKSFKRNFSGLPRRLPPVLAGNPVNYAKIGKLTTAEAIATALFIMGLDDQAHGVLNKFKWGHTFFELNCNLLADYSKAKTWEDISKISSEYGIMPSNGLDGIAE